MTSAALTTLAVDGKELLSHVLPHQLPIGINNHVLMMIIATVLVAWAFMLAARQIRVDGESTQDYLASGRLGHIFEVMLIYLREEVARPALGKLTDRYIGYVWTTFFFILFCNLLGLVPWGYGLQVVATLFGADHPEHWAHWQGTPTGNIAVTGALALVSMFMINFLGTIHGGKHYLAHHAPVPVWPIMKGGSPGMLPVALLLVVLEILGAFIKPFALCMRLFANMLAGHLVLGALIGLIFIAQSTIARGVMVVPVIAGCLAMTLLELFVAFLQAYIFAFLTVLFIAQGAAHDHDEHDHEPHTELAHLDVQQGMGAVDPEMSSL
ncbi:MAG: F0F1 ATP synthase subunit A [Phycisphaerae bacterium]|nr:F0F1 ATP synthase subunit A [Phycisphaerae bacterium]